MLRDLVEALGDSGLLGSSPDTGGDPAKLLQRLLISQQIQQEMEAKGTTLADLHGEGVLRPLAALVCHRVGAPCGRLECNCMDIMRAP